MAHVLSLGAINKHTGEYVYPKIANKKDEYICPECNKDLILVKGEVRVHHFRHKVDTKTPCNHYNKPTETQIHKDAKILLKTLLERKIPISFIRNCCECAGRSIWKLPEMNDTSIIKLEHRFEFNGTKIADVAWINDDKLHCIFEICNTHKTRNENRPEPWFEIDAETLIINANDDSLTLLEVPCIRRQIICGKCREIKKQKQAIHIISSYIRRNIYKQKYIISLNKYYKRLREKKEREIYAKEQHEIRETFRIRQLKIDDELNKVTTLKNIKHYETIARNEMKKCGDCKSKNDRCFTCRLIISKLGKDMRIKNLVSGLEQPSVQTS
jgi:uncharacterized protein YkuJ